MSNPTIQIYNAATGEMVNREMTDAEYAEWMLGADERKAQQEDLVRTERNRLLADCDWTQLPDAPVNAADWTAYRQDLRDITNQSGFPYNVVWPTPPGGA